MIQFMLDTNMVIYTMKRRTPELMEAFNTHANQMCISSITLAELIFGVENSANVAKNYRTLEYFLGGLAVFEYGERHARHYGAIKAKLAGLGQLIGDNDTHIAAHARCEGLIVVTNNTKHFSRIPELKVENWITL